MRIRDWSSDVCSSDLVGGVSEEYVSMEKNATSVIRWAGSKRKILPVLRDAYRKSGAKGRYVEPFAGSAALFFDLSPESAVLSDANEELVNALIKLQVDTDGLYAEVTSVDRYRVVSGKSVSESVDIGGRRIFKKKK